MKSTNLLIVFTAFVISTSGLIQAYGQKETKKNQKESSSSCDSYNQFSKKRGKRTLPKQIDTSAQKLKSTP